jgi:prevent-host-death family protein
MKTVTIRELHSRTGELVRQAKRHGQIIVTDHGEAVAKIVPAAKVNKAPYFSRRTASQAFIALERTGKTGNGTDATLAISQEREDPA